MTVFHCADPGSRLTAIRFRLLVPVPGSRPRWLGLAAPGCIDQYSGGGLPQEMSPEDQEEISPGSDQYSEGASSHQKSEDLEGGPGSSKVPTETNVHFI